MAIPMCFILAGIVKKAAESSDGSGHVDAWAKHNNDMSRRYGRKCVCYGQGEWADIGENKGFENVPARCLDRKRAERSERWITNH